mgnify:CR=1 FL=1
MAKVAFAGLGVMGFPMAGWLVKARQQLRAEVSGIYLNEVEHELQTVS